AWVWSDCSSAEMRLCRYSPRNKSPPPNSASARTLIARIRQVSSERRRRRARRRVVCSPAARAGAWDGAASVVAVAISNAIERLDLREVGVGGFEFLA